MKKSVLLIVVLGWMASLAAQKFTVNAHIDSTMIRIGSQAHLVFEIAQSKSQKITFPLFSDSIKGGLELAEPLKIDTVTDTDGKIKVTHRYTVTAFNDSLLYIPSFPFSCEQDTVYSNTLSLKVVQPFKIDTTQHQIADIKTVLDPKFDWDALRRICLVLLVLQILVVLGYFLIKKYWKKAVMGEVDEKPQLPPHIEAIEKLDKLKETKPWNQGRNKEYHTELTDILRTYIQRVYDIKSLEMTSDEILEELKSLRFEQQSAYQGLRQIFELADLVKFAKFTPAPNENELSMVNAYLFVNQTKVEDVKPLDEVISEIEKKEKE